MTVEQEREALRREVADAVLAMPAFPGWSSRLAEPLGDFLAGTYIVDDADDLMLRASDVAIAVVLRRMARKVMIDGTILACKKRRTKRLGLIRDPYPTELVREIAEMLFALAGDDAGAERV
jgi:hypothetical protein